MTIETIVFNEEYLFILSLVIVVILGAIALRIYFNKKNDMQKGD